VVILVPNSYVSKEKRRREETRSELAQRGLARSSSWKEGLIARERKKEDSKRVGCLERGKKRLTVLLHDTEESDDDLGGRSDEHLKKGREGGQLSLSFSSSSSFSFSFYTSSASNLQTSKGRYREVLT